MTNRHKRHSPSQCVTSSGQKYRHQRHTPLGGVTLVTLAEMEARLAGVPTTMPLNWEVKPGARLSAFPSCGRPFPASSRVMEVRHSPVRPYHLGAPLGGSVHGNVVGRHRCYRAGLTDRLPEATLPTIEYRPFLGGRKKRKQTNDRS